MKPIEILINAKDNASSVFDGLRKKVAAVGVAIAGYFGIQAFVGIVKGAADLEQGMSRVQAATGASAEEMAKLRKAAEDAGANTKYTSTEAALALENLAKAGLSATDAIAALPAVLNLAQAGDIELGTASEFVTKAVMGMGLAFTDAGRVADVLALGANATNTSVTGLAQALSYAAPVANSLGLSLESTVAIIGKFADAGIDASRAGTALNAILSQFANPASKFREELGAAGITTNNFEKALHQLAASGPRGAKAINAVGTEAGPALRALLNQGMGSLDALKLKLDGAAGSAAATAKVMQDNLNGSLNGLSSAWDTFKNALGTPVLPVLKDGVDQLAAAFKSAVADGTITKFGESIATAFQAGIKWVREFVGTVDFGALVQRMQAFADSAKQRFDEFGQYATNAGATVKVAVGGVQTAFGLLMVTAGGLSNALVLMLQVGLKGFELLYRASEKLTFGKLSAQYKAIADDFKLQSEAMGAASDAVSAQIRGAMDGIGNGLSNVRAGFAGVTGGLAETDRQAGATSTAIGGVTKELEAGAAAAAAYGVAQQKKVVADQQARQAADDSRVALAKLRSEYADLIASGNVQAAVQKFEEINKALQGTPAASKDAVKAAQDAAQLIADAFQRQNVTSSADLKLMAESALRDYNIVKNAGTSTAQDVGNMFKKAADAAIAASGGIVPSWVQAQAAARGYEVQVDSAGKATVRAMGEGVKAADGMAQSITASTEALKVHEEAMDRMLMRYKLRHEYTERQIALEEKDLALQERRAELERKRLGVDKDGFSTDKDGKRLVMGSDTGSLTGVAAFLKSAGVDNDTVARDIAREFADAQGNVANTNSLGMRKYGKEGDTISAALLRAAERYTFGVGGDAAQTPSTIPKPEQKPVYAVNITLDGNTRTINTDASGADVLQDLLRDLGRARSTASR